MGYHHCPLSLFNCNNIVLLSFDHVCGVYGSGTGSYAAISLLPVPYVMLSDDECGCVR